MRQSFKRLLAIMVACAICMFGTSFAYADDVTTAPVSDEEIGTYVTTVDVVVIDGTNETSDSGIMPYSYNNVLAGASTDFSWEGTASCVLGRSFPNCGIQAGISSNDSVGTVTCSVKFPSGGYHVLGTIPSSGGMTSVKSCGTLASGTYTFIFESSTSAKLHGVGYILN